MGTFNFNDQADDEVVSDDSDKESTPVEKTKTWNMPSKVSSCIAFDSSILQRSINTLLLFRTNPQPKKLLSRR